MSRSVGGIIGAERVAHQSGSSACYADIELEVSLAEHPGPALVEVAPGASVSPPYLAAVRVGVELALRLEPQHQQARVVVRRLLTMVVDSSEIVVLVVAARATLRALGGDPERAGPIDFAARTVTLPL